MTAADLVRPPLDFSPELRLPAKSAGAQTYGFIARKGGGKSYAAGKLAELLYAVGVPLIVFDPVGIWWGLRLAADGTRSSIDIPILGGLHGDVDLELDAAERLARHLVETGGSAVLDVSQIRKGKRAHFVAEFCEALFAAVKAQPRRRQRMVIFEEAQDFAPQHANGPSARLLGAVDDIVRLGRNFGLGSMLITQRPQSVHKEVLNQIECLFVGQLSAKHERDAIKGWILAKEDAAKATLDALQSLPYLAPGDFYCWSPQWLQRFVKTHCHPKLTFDASATPELDEEQPDTPALPAMDLEALRALMAPSPEPLPEGPRPSDAGRDREIEILRKERSATATELLTLQAEHATVTLALRDRDRLITELRLTLREVARMFEGIKAQVDEAAHQAIVAEMGNVPAPSRLPSLPPLPVPVIEYPVKAAAPVLRIVKGTGTVKGTVTHHVELPADPVGATGQKGGPLGRCALLIAGAVNAHGPMSRVRAAVLTGYKHSGGGFRNALSELRTLGFIQGSDPIESTDRFLVGPRPARGKALVELWNAQLGACAREILRVLLDHFDPQHPLAYFPVSGIAARTKSGDGTPYQSTGGGFRNSVSELRGTGLVVGASGELKLNPDVVADLRAR